MVGCPSGCYAGGVPAAVVPGIERGMRNGLSQLSLERFLQRYHMASKPRSDRTGPAQMSYSKKYLGSTQCPNTREFNMAQTYRSRNICGVQGKNASHASAMQKMSRDKPRRQIISNTSQHLKSMMPLTSVDGGDGPTCRCYMGCMGSPPEGFFSKVVGTSAQVGC